MCDCLEWHILDISHCFAWHSSFFKKLPLLRFLFSYRRCPWNIPWIFFDQCWASGNILPARCTIFNKPKVVKLNCGFGRQVYQFLLRWLKRFQLPAVHPLSLPEATKACNSSSNMNKCQLLAQQLMVCPSWPELFNSHRLSVRSPSFMGGKGLCHRHRSAIGNSIFPNFDRIEIVRLDHKIETDACSFFLSCWHLPFLLAFSFNNVLIYKHSK